MPYNALDTDIPVTILINRGSASASEIVAGTLQDYDRGVVIGEKSYGKGLVQVSRPLSYNSQLKVTTAKYYTPTGRCIQVLDYSHRREDGSVLSTPDSLKQAFKTTHGRTVFDGGGIDPDIKVEGIESHPLAQVLFDKGYIFDYVTEYVYKNPKPVNPREFALSDDDYQQFVAWMKGKDMSYKSYVEYGIQQLIEEAKKEKYYDGLKAQLEQINAKLNENKKNELTLYKDEIKRLIEEEIVARHYLDRGRIESAFQHDAEVKKAIEILHDQPRYKKVLNLQ